MYSENMKANFSAGFVLLAAALYFFDDNGIVSALVPAVAVHELGHALAIKARGARVVAVDFNVTGLRMDYAGYLSRSDELICAAAGPIAGLTLAFAASLLGRICESEYLLCVSGVSLILSLFNLLPASPLDGGIILSILLGAHPDVRRALLFIATLCVGMAMIASGLFCLYRGFGAALIPPGLWLIALTYNEKNTRLVKQRDLR